MYMRFPIFARHAVVWVFAGFMLTSALISCAQADDIKGYLPAAVAVADFPAAPAPGSKADQDDREAALDLQAKRTPERVALAQADQKLDVFSAYGSILGPKVTEASAPSLARLMARALRDVGATVLPFKELYKRPRPPLADPAVTACVRLPENGLNSYPSGHAMWGATAGTVLAELVPAKAEALKARGLDYGLSRAVCGVHYPSDVAAGQALSAALLAQLRKDPAFSADYEAAKAELAALAHP
jgi:acid phosphatase (class A)